MATGIRWLRLGWVMALLVGSGAWAEEPRPATPPADAPMAPQSESQGSSAQWELMAGAQAALDGYASTGHQGLLLGMGWEYPSVRLRFLFLAGVPDNIYDTLTHVKLEQYTFGFWLDTPVLRSGPVRWGVGAGAGLLVFARSSFSLARNVVPANPRFVPTLLTGPDTSVRWRLSRLFAVETTAAVDFVVGRPILGYEDSSSGGFVPQHRGWLVQPRLTVAFLILP
ncbi:hypothetical protein JY651_47640 [Pyxidicoccus parkwayensis]|uniref:Uncharacterized protein n=1 Tax=Pyxidicoccus parkwayensis TaxID=2813578 RepID=A0ABX7NUU6_9BACT|nr:hypothetical protein [Pyxidicoccus parkwaysis]QSQ22697.1 hypothetical protein JY651_47640 [Pyxidicoccus parkwaysis]